MAVIKLRSLFSLANINKKKKKLRPWQYFAVNHVQRTNRDTFIARSVNTFSNVFRTVYNTQIHLAETETNSVGSKELQEVIDPIAGDVMSAYV